MPRRPIRRHTPSATPPSRKFLARRDKHFQASPLRLYRPKRVAEMFDVDLSTIWRWQQDGILPPPTEITPKVKGWTEEQLREVQKRAGGRDVR